MLIAFGKYLRLVRGRRGMSLSDTVTLTKGYPEPVGKGYLSRVERGLVRVGFSKMVALARAYEIPLDALGEKLSLDLEVDELKNAPNTTGQTFSELLDMASELTARGLKRHAYAAVRDALPRAAIDPLYKTHQTRREQVTRSILIHGITARATGRYTLALTEFAFVEKELDALSDEAVPLVFEQAAVAKMRMGELDAAKVLSDRAVELALQTPLKQHLGDALDTRATLANLVHDYDAGIAGYQEAFAAYKAVDRQVDCARTMSNLASTYIDAQRFRAARTAALAAERLATQVGAQSTRARSRILLGQIEAHEGRTKKAMALWNDAADIARGTRDSVAQFNAELELYKLSIARGHLVAANALGKRLNRMTPWISHSEAAVPEFLRLYAIHRKPKQRSGPPPP
jgi:transcriptional regulator with XRE-family HTH domain